jgi:DNA repair exonuclease SbcCD ATPase subunit
MLLLNNRCQKCGFVFPAPIQMGNAKNISFTGTTVDPCPRCGGPAKLIADNTNFDVVDEQVVIRTGFLTPEDLAAVASTFTRFQAEQDNRSQVEEQIAQAFPQLQNKVQRLSNERLLLLISLLLALMTTWQANLPTIAAALQQVEQALSAVQQSIQKTEDQTFAEVFENYESGKRSVHALQKKIAKFFPELEGLIRDLPYPLLVSTTSLIVAVLNRWKPIKAKDFKGMTSEQASEMIGEIKALREAMTKPKDS